VRSGKVEPLETGESGERIWLRLQNNTRWIIWLEASGVPEAAYGDAALYYDVVDMKEGSRLPESSRCHVCSIVPLGSGKSLLFSVPRENLTENRKIKVRFGFDWQDKDDLFADREIESIVPFSASNLPKEVR